jgi:hypothetical protein
MLWPKGDDVVVMARRASASGRESNAAGAPRMQPILLKDDEQAGLNDLGTVLHGNEPAPVMLEPPDLHVDPVDRAMSLAAELPPPDPALRAAPVNDNVAPASKGRRSAFARAVARAVLAIVIGAAATVGWLSYGEAARQMLAAWAFVAPAPAPDVKVVEQQAATSEAVAQPTPVQPAVVAAATPVPENPAPPPSPAPVQAAPAPDLAPKLEDMAREIASLKQTIEQLKTGQQQLSRDLAKAIEQEPRRKTAAVPPPAAPKPVVAAPRNPPQQAYTPPPPPPPQRQVYMPPREQVYTPPPPQVYAPPAPQMYVPPPPSYDAAAPRPPRPLP